MYLEGSHFKVVTDHSALKALMQKENLEGRLLRWAEYFQKYDYEIIFRPGRDNVLADMLSRNLNVQSIVESEDSQEAIRRGLIYIPKDQRKSLLLKVHRIDLSHLRFEKMYQFLRLRYYWEGMTNDIKEILESCSVCARMSAGVPFQPLRPIESFYPFQ